MARRDVLALRRGGAFLCAVGPQGLCAGDRRVWRIPHPFPPLAAGFRV